MVGSVLGEALAQTGTREQTASFPSATTAASPTDADKGLPLSMNFQNIELRTALQVSIGDGGYESLQRRMRAQLNYVENTAFVLVLLAAIELAGVGSWWLAYVATTYLLDYRCRNFR